MTVHSCSKQYSTEQFWYLPSYHHSSDVVHWRDNCILSSGRMAGSLHSYSAEKVISKATDNESTKTVFFDHPPPQFESW